VTDILLDQDGDLHVTEQGDIRLTESVRQAVRVRLLWFFAEWRFWPDTGVPYFESVFIKNPDIRRIRSIVRDEAMSVDGVSDARDITISVNALARTALITFVIAVGEETHGEEVLIHA